MGTEFLSVRFSYILEPWLYGHKGNRAVRLECVIVWAEFQLKLQFHEKCTFVNRRVFP